MGFGDFNKDDEYMEEEGPLPGFRFHPTDQELVGFYLRRKLAKKPISLDLIKQIDIYKYEPWDLAKICSSNGEKEWYYFCKRGRKYKNSVRPNRVTGSGFWKATGIDKPIYSHGGEGKECIGLKKTLVYYRGSAGKGTKTDWMMHEFRLPSKNDNSITKNNEAIAPEAEIWTLCRILKRNVSQRKQFTSEVKQLAANKRISTDQKLNRMGGVDGIINREAYNISFDSNFGHSYNNDHNKSLMIENNMKNDQRLFQFQTPMDQQEAQLLTAPPSSNLWISPIVNDLFKSENWDELASVVKFAFDSPMICE